MNELEKFKLINACETSAELCVAILAIAEEGIIIGRKRAFDANNMALFAMGVILGKATPNVLTREFGIRQQALYIKYYTELEE